MACWGGAGFGVDFVKIVEKQNPFLFFQRFHEITSGRRWLDRGLLGWCWLRSELVEKKEWAFAFQRILDIKS